MLICNFVVHIVSELSYNWRDKSIQIGIQKYLVLTRHSSNYAYVNYNFKQYIETAQNKQL